MHSNPSSQSPSVILGGQSHGPQASSSFLRGKKSSGTYETELNCIGKKYALLSKEIIKNILRPICIWYLPTIKLIYKSKVMTTDLLALAMNRIAS